MQKILFEISEGQRKLGFVRKKVTCEIHTLPLAIPSPSTKEKKKKSQREFKKFLEMVGWCHLWIPNFGRIGT